MTRPAKKHQLSDIGKHFIIGLKSHRISSHEGRILSELKPLGVILRANNFLPPDSNCGADAGDYYGAWLAELAQLQQEVRKAINREQVIFAIDHEGGRVHRLPPPITHFPSAKSYAPHCAMVAAAMALELRALGFNLTFAPVADVLTNPLNTVIGERAFGSDAEQVAQACVEFATSAIKSGMLAVAKHFPGHGDTLIDSHEALPSCGLNSDILASRELLPFARLIEAKIPAILTSHVVYSYIDAALPASLSNKISSQLLRDNLRFKGVVITDDLDMKAIADNFTDEQVAMHALQAGADILLFNHDIDRALRVAKIACDRLNENELDNHSFSTSTGRVNKFLSPEGPNAAPVKLDREIYRKHSELVALISRNAR